MDLKYLYNNRIIIEIEEKMLEKYFYANKCGEF